MSKPKPTFVIDHADSDDEYFVVVVDALMTVTIKREAEGVVVDIRSLHSEDPIASTYAFDHDANAFMLPNQASSAA
jgi:hypothetical protein